MIPGLWAQTYSAFATLIIVVSVRLMFDFGTWNFLTHVTVWGSIIVFVLTSVGYNFVLIIPGVITGWSYHVLNELCVTGYFWLNLLLTITTVSLGIMLTKVIQLYYFPFQADLARDYIYEKKDEVVSVNLYKS